MPRKTDFKKSCKQCKRLVSFLKQVKKLHPDYYCQPVPAFGDSQAELLIVGLAPGMHGANATGRPFTGDASGEMLYRTLHQFGFSSAAGSVAEDALELYNCRITNAVKCLPPENKPQAVEINQCNAYLQVELNRLPDNAVIIALGSIAHNAVLKALQLKRKDYPFGHAAEYVLNEATKTRTLISSYHCSRYNTQTRRLTQVMFDQVFALAKNHLSND